MKWRFLELKFNKILQNLEKELKIEENMAEMYNKFITFLK